MGATLKLLSGLAGAMSLFVLANSIFQFGVAGTLQTLFAYYGSFVETAFFWVEPLLAWLAKVTGVSFSGDWEHYTVLYFIMVGAAVRAFPKIVEDDEAPVPGFFVSLFLIVLSLLLGALISAAEIIFLRNAMMGIPLDALILQNLFLSLFIVGISLADDVFASSENRETAKDTANTLRKAAELARDGKRAEADDLIRQSGAAGASRARPPMLLRILGYGDTKFIFAWLFQILLVVLGCGMFILLNAGLS